MIDECSGFQRKICHRGWAKCTLIFIMRNHNCGLLSTSIFRQRTMNSCGYQCQSLWSEKLEILVYCWLSPQANGGEERLMVDEIKHFH
jgi:hypothetical protein